jgi:hypothetical protein
VAQGEGHEFKPQYCNNNSNNNNKVRSGRGTIGKELADTRLLFCKDLEQRNVMVMPVIETGVGILFGFSFLLSWNVSL